MKILVSISAAIGLCAIAAFFTLLFFHKFLLLEFFMGPSFSYSDYQLMLAVSHGDDVQAEVALKNGADPNHLGLANETQLMMASQNGDVKSAEVLLKHGAKPDLKNEVGYTALMIASQFYRPEIDKMAKVLLEHGANPNLKADSDDAKSMGTEGYTALMIACRGSTFEMVQILLDHGADPRCVGADGKTALDIAKQRSAPQQREPMVKLLEQKLK